MVDDDTPPQPDPLRDRVLELLAAGPVPVAEIVCRLDEAGLLGELREDGVPEEELATAVLDEVMVDDAVWSTADDRLVLADHLTDGMVLTHRLTADELEAGEVALTPDLVVLDWNARSELELADGGRLRHRFGEQVPGEDTTVLGGPEGWLEGFAAGDVLAFTRRGRTVAVEAVATLADDRREVELLAGTVDGRIRPGESEEAVPLVLDALAVEPTPFRQPVRPLGELLEAAGLEHRGFSFGRAGEPWQSAGEVATQRRRDLVARSWAFDGCCQRAFDEVEAAFASFLDEKRSRDQPDSGGRRQLDARGVCDALGHGAVTHAFTDFVLDRHARDGDADLVEFASALVAASPKRAAPAHLLAALEAERRGDARSAETALRAALQTDPTFGPAAPELAHYELDRGHIDRAITLLRHPDLGEGQSDGAVRFLEELRDGLTAQFRHVGRNSPCPCGSGRKFKVCCQRRPKVPLSARTSLVIHRLGLFAGREHRRARLIGLASSACDPDDPDLARSLVRMAHNPVITDFLVFEGGVADEYLDERGHLLADDERTLIEKLMQEPRRLWEVVDVDRGVSMTMRDTKSGESVTVAEHLGSMARSPGGLMLARVARLDDQNQVLGAALEIPLRLRDSALGLIDSHPDADALAMWYGDAIAFPRLVNREGEVLELCRVEVATAMEVEELRAALTGVLGGGEDDTWTETWTTDQGEQILRGTVQLDAGSIVIDTNSSERLDRLIETVRSAVPDASVTSDERTDPREAMRSRHFGDGDFDPFDEDDDLDLFDDDDGSEDDDDLPMSPEMDAILEDFIRQKEIEWVDESIPALGGLTPRQALDDPTRREDLLSLLREMERMPAALPGGGRGFDASRIRVLLGLGGGA